MGGFITMDKKEFIHLLTIISEIFSCYLFIGFGFVSFALWSVVLYLCLLEYDSNILVVSMLFYNAFVTTYFSMVLFATVMRDKKNYKGGKEQNGTRTSTKVRRN